MFSGNTLVFHHCLCRKISLQLAVSNAAIPGTKGDTNLSYNCTCIPVTHSTACSIKLSSHHLKQTVLNIPRCCACTKRIAKGLATITVDNRSISSPKSLNKYYLYSYYQVFCTDINSFTPETNNFNYAISYCSCGQNSRYFNGIYNDKFG